MRKKYSYLNLSIESMPGEQWKDLPELEEYYMISNYGRIKRLEHEMIYKNGAVYRKEEKIIKPCIVQQRNRFMKDHVDFLVNRVIFNKKRYNFSIARIVYYCFIEKFDYNDFDTVILCRDADNFNIKPSNLRKATRSQKQKRAIRRNRFHSPFHELSNIQRKKQRQAIAEAVSKKVSQYDLHGNLIKTFSSMAEAQRRTGVFASAIGTRAAGKGKTAGGYQWRFGQRKKINPILVNHDLPGK